MKLAKSTVLGLSFVLFGAMGLHAAPALKVLSASPKGAVENAARQAVNVHFNQPVAPLGESTAFAADTCPLTISPSVEGSCRFSGSQTLVFEPAQPWPDATRFTVKVPKGFVSAVSGQKLAAAYSFSFDTRTPRVITALPYNNEHWLSLNPTLYILTSQPIDLERAAAFVTLHTGEGKSARTVPLALRKATQEELDKNFSYLSAQERLAVFAINPAQDLQPGQKYTLTLLSGLPAQTGTLGMAQPYETSFYTYPPLTVQKVLSTGCLPFTPSVHFSSPVRKHELYAAIQTEPAAAKTRLNTQEKDSLGSEFVDPKTGDAYFNMPLSFITFKPYERVKVTIQKGLRDIYGNTLAKDESFTISNNGYCPKVDFSADGLGVLESYLPARLPISLMNVPFLWVEAARFNKENFIPFYEQKSAYCAKKQLTGATFSGEYRFPAVQDMTLRTYMDLLRFKPTATDSIIFSQFKRPATAQEAECWMSATDNITDIGVTFKTSPKNNLIWTTSLKTGQPLGGLKVELRSKDNQVLWTGTTDASGLAIAPGWDKLDVPAAQWGQPTLYAFITSPEGDAVVSNLWNDGLEPWRFNINYEYTPTVQPVQTYLFAERGIYRPGETVHIKGVVRSRLSNEWKLPDVVRGSVSVTDGRGEELLKKDVTVSSDYGTFDWEVTLPSTAVTGTWDVVFVPQLKMEEPPTASTSFQVESVKPADFNVFVNSNLDSYLSGDEATFTASAQYYFGAPLTMAPVKWNLRQEPTWFTPKGYEKYTFTPYFLQRTDGAENGKLLLNGAGELNSRGELLFAAKMPHVQVPVRVYAEVDIQSPARQNLFKRTSVLVHPADIYVGAKPGKDTYEQDREVDIHIVAVTPQGKPAETTVTAEIYKEEYYSVRKVGLAGRLEWVSEKKVIPFPARTLTVGKKGATLTFTPHSAGSYYIKLTAKDLFGRTVQGGTDVYVYGTDSSYGRRQDDDLLPLTQNKNEYKVGQTARIAVSSPYETAQALVTVEREGILDAWVTTVKGGQSFIQVPIKDTYLPNVYVGVTLVQGRSAVPPGATEDLGKPQGKTGYVNLNVVPDHKRIATTLKTNAKNYRPGQQVTVDLTTKVRGKGVPAEVVVMAVDEGILALSNYQTPDLFDYFYGSVPISVFTMDNRSYVIGQRNFGQKGENRGGGGGANSKLGGTDLRSRFLFTPYYQAAVKTNEKGRAQVSFELPDNLTTFRIMAVSLTQSEFGNAQETIRVSKPVMVTPNLPRFAREGDRFACGVIVHNYEDSKASFTVQATAQGSVELDGPTQQLVKVPQGQSQEVTWQCHATRTGFATLAFVAKGRYSDGVQSDITVSTPEREQTLAVLGATQTHQEELIDRPAQIYAPASNRVSVSAASTALLQLKGALTYLLNYPYNCLEQQLSKIVPAVRAAALVRDFQLADETALRKQTQEVLSNLPAYQHISGGFGYWPNSSPDRYVTAYALEVALQAKKEGFDVPSPSLDKAVLWLEKEINQPVSSGYAYSTQEREIARSYGAYVLAGYGKNIDSLFNTLYAQRAHLPQTALGYLLQAAQASGRSAQIRQALAQQLTNKLVYTPTYAYVDVGAGFPWLHITNVAATAHTLQALLQAGLAPDNAYQMAAWLVSQLNAQGNWNDTYTNAAVLTALQTYYQTVEAAGPHFTATVTQGDQTRLTAVFEGRSLQEQTAQAPFDEVYAQGTEARFTFAKEGVGTLYYMLSQHYTPASYDSPVDSGFSLTRTLSTLDGKPVGEILPGERYKVTLHVKTAAARSFVAVEDYIPAGFNLVNTSLATESASQAELLSADNALFNRVEQYEDRIYGFADELPAGEHTFSYLVTAVAAGTYTYPAAWVSQMYAPEVFGRNTTSVLVIK